MNIPQLQTFVAQSWERDVLPSLMDFIRIPALSPNFDPAWAEHGVLDQAAEFAKNWCDNLALAGLLSEIVRLPGRTPLLWVEIPGDIPATALFYGHLDKQPEAGGWRDGLGPWQPVIEDDKLYGRGAVDDGYALYTALTAIRACKEQGVAHPRCVLLIECSEESGSPDLPAYLDFLATRIGTPDLVIGLDSGCGDYQRLWVTTSLRGLLNGVLDVAVLTEGVHSGDAGGVVASSFRIIRHLLDRLEDSAGGEILPRQFHTAIPPERVAQTHRAAAVLGDAVYTKFPSVAGLQPLGQDPAELLLKRAWHPALAVTGADGLPPTAGAGNQLRVHTALKLSLRLPPGVAANTAALELKNLLEADPPHAAHVSFTPEQAAPGWNAAPPAAWFEAVLHRSSQAHFGNDAVFLGEGVTIPFAHLLGSRYPAAQFLITGVLGPASNAHGPNEFLHLAAARKLTACLAQILAACRRAA